MARARGPQNPGKYPSAPGSNYAYYGEQPGYIYNPYTDKYAPDPKVQGDYLISQGLMEKPKKPDSLMDTLIPVAGTAAALYGGQALAPQLVGSFKEGTGLLGGAKDLLSGAKESLGFGGSSAPVASTGATAGQVASAAPLAADAGANAAWNAAAMEASGAPATLAEVGGAEVAPGLFDLSGIGAPGNAILPVAGAIGAYDLIANNRAGGTRGALQGAASGAAMGSYFGVPGAAIGAVIGGGYGLLGGSKQRYKTEWKRKRELVEQGILDPSLLGPEPMAGRSKADLIAEAQATGGNVDFARTRNEDFLQVDDIKGYARILEKAHETGLSPEELSQKALAAKAVREHHGTIDVDWKKVNLNAPATPGDNAMNPAMQAATMELAQSQLPGGVRTPVSKPGGNMINSGLLSAYQLPPGFKPGPMPIINNPFGAGHWEDSQGNLVTGIDPGFTMGNVFVPDNPSSVNKAPLPPSAISQIKPIPGGALPISLPGTKASGSTKDQKFKYNKRKDD